MLFNSYHLSQVHICIIPKLCKYEFCLTLIFVGWKPLRLLLRQNLFIFLLQVRDSLAQTLNTEIMDTIQKLDKIGRSETIFQKGGHVAHVHVPAANNNNDEQYSSSTSGIYSVEGSEGSNSPEYNSWRSRVQPQQPQQPPPVSTASPHRWSSSIPGNKRIKSKCHQR